MNLRIEGPNFAGILVLIAIAIVATRYFYG